MLIGAYGTFWDRNAVDWAPGSGPTAWQLLGHRGWNNPNLRVADFRRARGVYILYDNHGAYYSGLARGTGGLGARLKKHTTDKHEGKWTRFSWFAFDTVTRAAGKDGLHHVLPRNKPVPANDEGVIRELEALLITVLGTRGQNQMRFQAADEWLQVPWWDEEENALAAKVAAK